MTVFRFELKKQLASALIWTGVITAVLWLMLYGFYPVFLSSREAMENMIASFPAGVAAAFGFDLDDMFSFKSFSGMVYLYEGILGAIAAAVTAIAVFAREKQSKCMDFLLTKPLSRSEIFFQKLLCCIVIVAIINIPYIALFSASFFDYTGAATLSGTIVLSVLCLFFTQLVFFSIGIFAAVFVRRIRSSSGLGTGIGIFAFLLSIVHSLTELKIFKFFSPIYYFSPVSISETGGYDAATAVTAVILIIVLTGAAFVRYTKSDVAV